MKNFHATLQKYAKKKKKKKKKKALLILADKVYSM